MTEQDIPKLFNTLSRCIRPIEQAFSFIEDSIDLAEQENISSEEALAQIKNTLKIASRELHKISDITHETLSFINNH